MATIHSELLAHIATNVRTIREQRGLSREQLAASTDLDTQMIKRIESGRANPALTVLSRLAAAMAISLSLIVGGADAETIEAETIEPETVGETLVLLRKEKHMSQRRLAQRTGLRMATLRRYESGETDPRIEAAELIARALEIEPVELVRQIEQRQLHTNPDWRRSTIVAPGVEQRILTNGERSELWEWRFEGNATAETTTPAGIAEEVATAIRGDLVVTIDGAAQTLSRGASVTIVTKKPWQIANDRNTLARLLRFQVRI
ncbi:MAG TPA: helix-turn-helix domain-containing protein [Thermoanaerobaculia bacterium]|nr:helix-turn-helix domain-containing protein [Thermoanaerobaculia bacterium]